MIRFSGTPLDCSFVSFSPQQTLVERCFKLPSAASFPRPSSGRRPQRLMAILFTAGQHSPGHASQLVGDRDHDFVARSTLSQPMHPLPESSCVVLNAKQYRAGTVDQNTT